MSDHIFKCGHIGVLLGGCSSEREISLKSGQAIYGALKRIGCRVSKLDFTTQDEQKILSQMKEACIDVAFIALHGRFGEDGELQAICEKARIPYTGSGVDASAIAINKVLSYKIFKQEGIPIPEYKVLIKDEGYDFKNILNGFNSLPVIVKPAKEGSSIGLTKVEKKEELPLALDCAFQYDQEIIVEKYIQGRELTVGILEDKPLPVLEIRPKNRLFDFDAKYTSGLTEYIVPAHIPQEDAMKLKKIAVDAHRVLGCTDFSRVDIMLDENHQPFVLEVNTIPGFTSTSLLPKAAKAIGLDFDRLCLKLVELAYEKKKKK